MRALKEEMAVHPSDCRIEIQRYEMILTDALKVLNERERIAIFLRFWQPCSIAQVASHLKISWEAADRLIDGAVEALRREFKNHKYYNHQSILSSDAG
ncbi:MAG: hypothetical protein JNM24_04780 [Bdellovibrionaceae bacterium]|nr:hypothetical protein [Pseudobdellovibrionaceae bacterium]